MDITWHGQSCFTIKGKTATVVVDPFGDIGLRIPKLTADILLISHDHFDHSNRSAVSGDPYVVDVPGEYESHGVMIEGLPTYHDDKSGADRGRNTVFSFSLNGVHFVHLGDLGHVLSNDDVERLGDVDVLFVPVGGHFTIDAKAAVEVIKQLQPRVVIPMHYKIEGLSANLPIAGVNDFLKEVGSQPKQLEQANWKFKPADLPEENLDTIVFANPRR